MLAVTKRFFRIHALVAIALAGVAASASAEAPSDVERERSDIVRKLDEYKQRVHALEERLRQLDAHAGIVTTEHAATEHAAAEHAVAASCGMPFAVDSEGIKHMRPECLEVATQGSCEMPFFLDAQGVKRMREGCTLDPTRLTGR